MEEEFTQTCPGPPPGAAAWLGTCARIADPAGGVEAVGVGAVCEAVELGAGAAGAAGAGAVGAAGAALPALPEEAVVGPVPDLLTPPW